MTDRVPAGPGPGLIAVDWGTTRQRAWLLDRTGHPLAARSAESGLLNTSEGIDIEDPRARAAAYAAAFDRLCGDWLDDRPGLPTVACGMVGSAQGWVDAGYRTVPTTLAPAPDRLVRAEHASSPVWIVPGLRVPAAGERPGDVLRGEETQVLGLLPELPGRDGAWTVVLPGTHTKWLHVNGDEVTGFTTTLTGELFGLEMRHGILGRTVAHRDPAPDDAAFGRGLDTSASGRGLAVELFGARALALDGPLSPSALPDYVSGVLIGHEVHTLLPAHASAGDEIVLCGSADLTRRYRTALAAHGVRSRCVDGDVVVHGLRSAAVAAGLLPDAGGHR